MKVKLSELTEEQKEDLLEAIQYNNILEEITGQRRWVTEYWVVFKWNGKTYATEYEQGSTEMQEDYNFFEYKDEIELTPVEYKDVTVKKWVPMEE